MAIADTRFRDRPEVSFPTDIVQTTSYYGRLSATWCKRIL